MVQNFLAGDKLLRRIEWTSYSLLTLMTLGAWGMYSARMASGVLLGAAISIASFQILKRQLTKAFHNPAKMPGKGKLFFGYYLRFLGALFLVFVVLYYGLANPIAFVIGLSVMVISVLLIGGFEFLALVVTKGEG